MKYLITESQLDKVIFRYLDNQDFIKIKKNNKIYFINSEGDEYAQIRYDKSDGWCTIERKLMKEIVNFFSLDNNNSILVIAEWTESKTGLHYRTVDVAHNMIVRYF